MPGIGRSLIDWVFESKKRKSKDGWRGGVRITPRNHRHVAQVNTDIGFLHQRSGAEALLRGGAPPLSSFGSKPETAVREAYLCGHLWDQGQGKETTDGTFG